MSFQLLAEDQNIRGKNFSPPARNDDPWHLEPFGWLKVNAVRDLLFSKNPRTVINKPGKAQNRIGLSFGVPLPYLRWRMFRTSNFFGWVSNGS